MKRCDKYPSASEDDIQNLPKQIKFLGLHPLVWVVIIVLFIAAGRACETVEELGCGWDFWEIEDEHDDSEDDDSENDNGDDHEDAPATVPEDEPKDALKSDEEDD